MNKVATQINIFKAYVRGLAGGAFSIPLQDWILHYNENCESYLMSEARKDFSSDAPP